MHAQTANSSSCLRQESISAEQLIMRSAELLSGLLFIYDSGKQVFQYHAAQWGFALGYGAPSPFLDLEQIIHPEDLGSLHQVIGELPMKEGARLSLEIRFRASNGHYLPFAVSATRKVAAAAIVFVATPTKENNAVFESPAGQLSDNHPEAESILAFGSFEFHSFEDAGFWSEGMYQLFEYGAERPPVTYSTFLSQLSPDRRKENELKPSAMTPDAQEYTAEWDIVTKKGQAKRVQIIGRRITNAEQQAVKDIGIVRDVTRLRAQETQLQKAVEDLQRSNKELEEFAYIASHDLQEPLRKISTFGGRLLEKYATSLNSDGDLYLSRIMAAADSMRALIENLLEFSRISRIKQPFVPLNLDFVLHQVKEELELNIEEAGVMITADALPVIDASAMQMRQLFSNIINNAIKFRRADIPPEIQIRAHCLTPSEKRNYGLTADKEYIALRFADNGIGFEEEYASRIFQIFQRLHGKADYPGSGIGLAICKKIVDHHGGKIFAESRSGSGACFTIILPEKQSEQDNGQ